MIEIPLGSKRETLFKIFVFKFMMDRECAQREDYIARIMANDSQYGLRSEGAPKLSMSKLRAIVNLPFIMGPTTRTTIIKIYHLRQN